MHDAIRRRIADLEAKKPTREYMSYQEMNECQTPRAIAFAARIGERMAAYKAEKGRYAAMSTPQKIAAKKRELADNIAAWESRDRNAFCINTEQMHQLRCRLLKIDIQELEGASADVIETARTQANEDFRSGGKRQREVQADTPSIVIEPKKSVQPRSRVGGMVVDRDPFEGPRRDPIIEP